MLNETRCIHCGRITLIKDKLAEDYRFGNVFSAPASAEDQEAGIDHWLVSETSSIPLSWRKRRIQVGKYKQISIRHSRGSGSKTELQKFLDNEIRSWVYLFEFKDAIVICSTEDIKKTIHKGEYQVQPNYDAGDTAASYINLDKIEHLLVMKKEKENASKSD